MPSSSDNKTKIGISTPPIGVFDSGIGGLSVLISLIKAMPHQRFVYMADTAYAPYGEQPEDYIIDRSHRIAKWLHDEQGCAGVVIACNTATAVAAKTLRETFGESWPIVGVEPGLKPAAQVSKTGRIGIMATAATLKSDKFHTLMRRVHDNEKIPLTLSLCACDGLARAIEYDFKTEIDALVKKYTEQLLEANVDVVVLGCTHYALIKDRIMQALPGIPVLDTGDAVARQVQRVFSQTATEKRVECLMADDHLLQAWSNTPLLQTALKRWLPWADIEVKSVDL